MYDLIIRDATIIRSTGRLVADIAVEDGRIAYVGSSASGGSREEISGIGRFVMPGVIDTQVSMRVPGLPGGPDWARGSRAAAASGVTTVLELPGNDAPVLGPDQARAALALAAKASVVNHGTWGSVGPDHVEAARTCWDEGLVAAPLVRLDAAEGPLAFDGDGFASFVRQAPGLVGVHAEDAEWLGRHHRKWAAVEDPIHNDVRPPKAAAEAVQRILALVKETGHPVHLVSLSTAAELNILDPYRGDLPITCSLAPYHLFLSVETAERLRDAIKVDPPVRTELDRRALWAAVKRGRIDMFVSGHVPRPPPEPGRTYWDVLPGIPGVDTLYLLLMGAVKNGRMGLERFVEMCCEAPARVFGLEGKGVIEEGADADLLLFAEGVTGRLRKAPAHATVDWTPYVGREVGAFPELVLVQGRIVARGGELAADLQPGAAVRYAR